MFYQLKLVAERVPAEAGSDASRQHVRSTSVVIHLLVSCLAAQQCKTGWTGLTGWCHEQILLISFIPSSCQHGEVGGMTQTHRLSGACSAREK
jgi:hypothetical protein